MRREFELPDGDIEYLNAQHENSWEAVKENQNYLIIRNYSLPAGYNLREVDLLIIIPSDYPPNQLDMFYLKPEIARSNGSTINTICLESHLNESWQRWSRHYAWNSTEDSLTRHIVRISTWLTKEGQ